MTSRLRATPALTVVVLIAVVAGVGVRPVRAATGDPSSGTDAPELIQQIIAAYGGIERWNAIRDGTYILRDISHRNTDGKAIVAETRAYFTKDPRPAVRLDLVHGENLHTKVFDGLEAWIAVDGVLLHKGPAMYQRVRQVAQNTMLWVAFPFNLIAPGTRVDYLGKSRFMGVDTYILQVTWDADYSVFPDDIHRFHLNRLTHLLFRSEYFVHGETKNRIDTLYGEYRVVGGLVKDHLREIIATVNGRTLQRIEVEELRFGVDLPAELFRKPPDPLAIGMPIE